MKNEITITFKNGDVEKHVFRQMIFDEESMQILPKDNRNRVYIEYKKVKEVRVK